MEESQIKENLDKFIETQKKEFESSLEERIGDFLLFPVHRKFLILFYKFYKDKNFVILNDFFGLISENIQSIYQYVCLMKGLGLIRELNLKEKKEIGCKARKCYIPMIKNNKILMEKYVVKMLDEESQLEKNKEGFYMGEQNENSIQETTIQRPDKTDFNGIAVFIDKLLENRADEEYLDDHESRTARIYLDLQEVWRYLQYQLNIIKAKSEKGE
jgi:hypothetical protein